MLFVLYIRLFDEDKCKHTFDCEDNDSLHMFMQR